MTRRRFNFASLVLAVLIGCTVVLWLATFAIPLYVCLELFVFPMLATILVTALLCRYRIAHKKPISYGTVFAGASVIPYLYVMFFLASSLSESDPVAKVPTITTTILIMVLRWLVFAACLCVLPALGVVNYYQRRSKRDEKPTA